MTDYEVDRLNDFAVVSRYLPVGEVLGFIAAHGIDFNDVPAPSTITIDDGKVTFTRVVRGADGKEIVEDDLHVKRETVTVDQRAPWPLDSP